MSLSGLLNSTCTIQRPSFSVGSNTGAKVPTWSDAATAVPCSVQVDTSYEATLAKREAGVTRYSIYFLPDTDVRVEDTLSSIVGAGVAWTGRKLAVKSAGTDGAGRRAYTKVTAEEIGGGGQR